MRKRRGWGSAVVLAAIFATGCWEVVEYQPPGNGAPGTGAGMETTADDGTAPAVEPDATTEQDGSTEPPATDAGLPGAGTAAGDLFDDDLPPATEGDVAATGADGSPTAADAGPVEAPITDAERRDAWVAASDWALAAAMSGKPIPAARYQLYLDQARAAADALGISLPALPASADPAKREAAAIAAMRAGGGAELVAAIGKRLDPAAEAAAQLALTAHLLLLSYSPLDGEVVTMAMQLRDAGGASQLPAELWNPLVDVLSRRVDFDSVKSAVFALRQGVAEYLNNLAGP